MYYPKQLFTTLFLLLTITYNLQAQESEQQYQKALTWYADRCEKAIARFEFNRRDSHHHPQKYCLIPYQEATPYGHALVLSTLDEQELFLLKPNGKDVSSQPIKKEDVPKDIYWENISFLGRYRTHSTDITLKGRPLPVRNTNKKTNTFQVVVDGSDGEEDIAEVKSDIKSYNQMIFKPHRNPVRLDKQHEIKETNEEGMVTKNQMEYVFKLNDPSIVSKMFRGYDDGEMCPWVVKNSFFNDHTLLQYGRWKYGEPVKKASSDVCRIISNYYGGRRIKDTRWLATLESGDRSFYAVQFEISGTDALAAMVCIGKGEVTSAWEFHGKVEPGNSNSYDSIWFVDDEGDFMGHAPEIHCIASTSDGLELYVRQFGGESVQYSILREMGPVLMSVLTDYWIYVWD